MMNQELFLEFSNWSEKKRKLIRSSVYLVALAFFALGTLLMAFGVFGSDIYLISPFVSLVSIGIAYFAVGVSFLLTWVNIDIAELDAIDTTNTISMMNQETQKKIDENNKLIQELLDELRIENK